MNTKIELKEQTQTKSNRNVGNDSAKLIIITCTTIILIHDNINEFHERYESLGLRYDCIDNDIYLVECTVCCQNLLNMIGEIIGNLQKPRSVCIIILSIQIVIASAIENKLGQLGL